MVKILYFLSTYILIRHFVELSFIIFATILRNDINYYRILLKKNRFLIISLSDLRVPVQLSVVRAVEETIRLSSASGEPIIY